MNFINGEWRSGGGDMFASHDPASGDAIWSGEAAAPDDVAAALGAARSVSAAWARTPLDARLGVVRAFKDQLEAQKPALAEMISRETGKALWESEGEAGAMIGKIGISIKAYDERTGVTETETAFGSAVLRHKPHGVMAVFGPYNFPGHLPNGHIVPALIAGDTVVFKPSELTPAVGEFMVNAWDAAGAPPGVVNLVQGARETGAALADGDIDGLLFTGSVDTGVMFHRKFAGRPDIILALEMGGNNPLVVWNAADAEAAAIVALQSAFITTGQRCSCARRMAVEAGAKGDAIVEALIALAARARIGAWNSEPEPFMGPLVSAAAAQQTLDGQAVYAGMGGRVLLEAKRLDAGAAFVSPGIVDMTDATDVQDAEIFGAAAAGLSHSLVRRCDRARERHQVRLVRRPGQRRCGVVGALRGRDSRRDRQLEPTDDGGGVEHAVRRPRIFRQSPRQRLLCGGLLRVPNGEPDRAEA